MANTKAQVAVRKSGRNDVLLIRRSHYRRLLRRIEDLEDALTLDRAENNSKRLVDYAEIRERLKQVGKL
jgi:PHD/YefM family antitoxin component YafN of YafNO toxin-antitoxin module